MYIVLTFFADGSGKPELSFVRDTVDTRDRDNTRKTEDVMAEVFEKINDPAHGDRHEVWRINGSVSTRII